MKEGTDDTPHGIGIRVDKNGSRIDEGYWEDGWLHGRGRYIYRSGEYYIGEYNKGSKNGEGTLYRYGDRYEGEWKGNCYYGQGTLYTEDGDKYTGIWDDWNKGQGEINYKDGTRYTGRWDYDDNDGKLKRHGSGTLYSKKGQVLYQGMWVKDKYKGKE